MKKTNLIFFHSKEQEKILEPELRLRGNLISFPLDRFPEKEKFDPGNSLVVIYDSSQDGHGIQMLMEVNQKLPKAPVLVAAENPSKEFLMAALNLKVSHFFTLPLEKEVFFNALDVALALHKKAGFLTKTRHWWSSIRDRTSSLFQKTFGTHEKKDDLKNLEVLGIAPYNLFPFLGKELEQDNAYDLNVQFFGQLNIKIRGKTVPSLKGKKNATVLAYLLFHHHKSIHRDVLIDRFWCDYSTTSAKNSLHVAICSIRKELHKVLKDQEVILYENESYCINPELDIITDIEKFKYFWKKGRAIEASQGLKNALPAYNKAIGLYQKEFLENLRFEDWCVSERDNLREIYLFILNRLSTYFYEQRNLYACINICKKMLITDECLEEVHRKLMRCYSILGMTDLAYKQFFKCKKVLEEELNLQPSKPTLKLFECIQEGAVVDN